MPDAAHGGECWEPRGTAFKEEIGSIWAKCGVNSECGTLRSVLLHKPGDELDIEGDHRKALWHAKIDKVRAQEQHDAFADKYRSFGVKVNYVKTSLPLKPNSYFMRDVMTMTPEGAIVARPASRVRAGEECIAAANLAALGIPIILSVHADGIYEGADLMYVDESLAFVNVGIRTNEEGYRQVSEALRRQGIDTLLIQATYGCGHIDGVMSIMDRRKVIVYPTRLSYIAYSKLVELGYKVLELPDLDEAENGMAINMVPIAPGCVLMPKGNKNTKAFLEKNGIECHEIDVSELMKGGGAVHCMTGVLERDPV